MYGFINKIDRKKMFLALILIVAFILRFWSLSDYPALNADEAAIGYNAYSLLETGKDEHGNSWPIHFQSFNDYKPGLYFYMVLPFVKFLGLNAWAVRIPSAALGVATVFIVFLLIKELKIGSSLEIRNLKLGIEEIGAFMLAISPWHIHFSRGGWEVNVATFLITLGLYFFVKAVNETSKKLLTFSVISFVLSLYTYHSARVVVPLLVIGLLVLKKNFVKKNFKKFLAAGAVGLILLLPLARDLAATPILSRASGVGLFADPGPIARINEQRGQHKDFASFTAILFHNKAVNYGLEFLENWTDHFSGEFLFLSGDNIERNKVPETGAIYLFDILFLAVAFFAIAKNKKSGSADRFGWGPILLWILFAPSAAALTFQTPHALRAQNMSVPLDIVSAYGLLVILGWLKKQNRNLLVIGSWSLVILVSVFFLRYQHMYWVHMAKEYPFSSQYGVEELTGYVEETGSRYENIVVTDRYDQPYILFLFYTNYSPERFQEEHELTKKDEFGFSTVREFGKYRFVSIDDWERTRSTYPNSLIAGTEEEIPDEANVVDEIYGSNGYKYFQVVAN